MARHLPLEFLAQKPDLIPKFFEVVLPVEGVGALIAVLRVGLSQTHI